MTNVSFDHVIRTRRTARAYRSEPVADEVLRDLVELATLAPSGMNSQPWRFSIVTSRDVLKKVNESVKQAGLAMMAQAPAIERFRAAFENPQFDIFYGAPALVVIAGPKGGSMGAMDCLLAVENLILAAHAKGLGTWFMGFLLMARDNEEIRRALAVDDSYEIVAPIVVGASDAIPQSPPERRPAEIAWVR
jgi:nitroreductase